MRITYFRNLSLGANYATAFVENSELREKLGIKEHQLDERVNDLNGTKAGRIPANTGEADESYLSSDDEWDSLTDLIKDRIRKDLSRFDYDYGEGSADGGQKENDSSHQFKADITEVVICIVPG